MDIDDFPDPGSWKHVKMASLPHYIMNLNASHTCTSTGHHNYRAGITFCPAYEGTERLGGAEAGWDFCHLHTGPENISRMTDSHRAFNRYRSWPYACAVQTRPAQSKVSESRLIRDKLPRCDLGYQFMPQAPIHMSAPVTSGAK